MIKFTGILTAKPRNYMCNFPKKYIHVDNPHITLLSYELDEDSRSLLKHKDLSILPKFPMLTWGHPYIVNNNVKESVVRDAIEQNLIKFWLKVSLGLLQLNIEPDPNRIFHVSIANRTGSQYDSVPDPWNHKHQLI